MLTAPLLSHFIVTGKSADKPPASTSQEIPALPLENSTHRNIIWLKSPVTDARQTLIQKVEAKFASGEQNYKAGHLEAARKDFDEAVDWMLQSGYDPNSDPRLAELFHRVVDTVYTDELQAFRAGDGFNEAPAVPAPIDEVADMTFPVDPRLKARAEEAAKNISHDLPTTVNDEVLSFLNFFQTPRGRAIVETGLRRAGRYREMIARVLAEEGVPQDLIYLAQAESAFQPTALSRAGARGMWQFVAYRGQEYGLRHTWWLDERQDPEKATHAAAQHLLSWSGPACGRSACRSPTTRSGYTLVYLIESDRGPVLVDAGLGRRRVVGRAGRRVPRRRHGRRPTATACSSRTCTPTTTACPGGSARRRTRGWRCTSATRSPSSTCRRRWRSDDDREPAPARRRRTSPTSCTPC